jgi:hypothetical protein
MDVDIQTLIVKPQRGDKHGVALHFVHQAMLLIDPPGLVVISSRPLKPNSRLLIMFSRIS